MTVGGIDVVPTARRFFKEFSEDELTVRAGDLAYRFFLALFPFALFLAAMGGVVASAANIDNPTEEVMNLLGDALPEDAASVVEGQVDAVVGQSNPALLSIGILGAIWAASSGVGSLIRAINKTYDATETRGFVRLTALSVAVTVVGGIAIIGLIAAVILGQVYAEDIAGWLGITSQFNLFMSLAQIPLILVVLLTAIALIYWIAPNTDDLPFRWISPGAVAFILLWAPFTVGFGLYVANFASYNATYGALGGIVILMLWFYYSSLLLLAGAELNAVLAEETGALPADDDVAEEQTDSGDRGATGHRERGRDTPRDTAPAPRPGALTVTGPSASPPDGHSYAPGTGNGQPHEHHAGPLTTPFMAIAGIALAAVALRKIVR